MTTFTKELINNSSMLELKQMATAISERQRILRERNRLLKQLS